uniref:Ribosomal protein L18e/L15P domain-containing protein n=1 Tax=Bos indicus x Bos taurus TaxID=30522 RepID=A0A4W2HJN8_BOBOX
MVSVADTPSRLRKIWKLKGHMSHGHSRHWKPPGDQGNTGGMRHHRTNFDKYHPGNIGLSWWLRQ